ncbi:hypothetical protein FISHEDRAFT_34889 [Fistulina hepatica ATCC 64428]|uniref:SH3 domain-containing protein n=1 Tax=Fistulina hepatica ATCC 64428 TaxID=1128425 RepID=A0A0D7AL81_9AGAR|nr:hypothetical protein FISHEDRAFT_34889 [Fistulina hepatica ATCC 64428]
MPAFARGNEGLDFTPILTHYLFLFTSILSVIAWFVAFISQIVATAKYGNGDVGVAWFAIFLQLFVILGVLYTLASDSISMHRFQVSIFGSIAIVFAVVSVNESIYTGRGALQAMAAGYLILAIVDIIWVLYFTAEEDSLCLYIFNSLGTGGLTPPSRRRRGRATSVHNTIGNGGKMYSGYASGAGIGSHDMQNYESASAQEGATALRSQHSFGAGSGIGNTAPPATTNGGSLRGSGGQAIVGGVDADLPSSPLMSSPRAAPPAEPGASEHLYKAKALYAYTASPDDPNELSFAKGEILDILDKQGKWWQARRADGTVGIAPSNYLQIV